MDLPSAIASYVIEPAASQQSTQTIDQALFDSKMDATACPDRLSARPAFNIRRLSSLDLLLSYREQLVDFDRAENSINSASSSRTTSIAWPQDTTDLSKLESGHRLIEHRPSPRFRSPFAEIGFCFSIAMTQLLSEVYITGFALVLIDLLKNNPASATDSTGSFWPAALLSLVISSMLLVWARVADMYGGYLPLMFGLLWLTIWSVIPGCANNLILLDVSRAMQGFAISSFMPAVFVLLGQVYDDGPRKNIVIGIYGACAPIGFYIGFVIGGALPTGDSSWFFFITASLAFVTMLVSYVSIPHDQTDRKTLDLKMDWLGAFAITSGLILVAYALAVEPYRAQMLVSENAFSDPAVFMPLVTGLLALVFAVWVEGWYATCPLLPYDFFRPRGVKAFCMTCLFFYGSFGVWIYNTSEYFNIPSITGQAGSVSGMQLVLWYTPLVVGGIIFCIVGSAVTAWVPMKVLLILSGLAWIGAPLMLALCPAPLHYWAMILPSMVFASLGTDLTFTVSNIFLSSSQPQKYQGMAGAVSSILFNLGISFALPLSQIVYSVVDQQATEATGANESTVASSIVAYRAAFFYGAASAVLGLLVCLIFWRPARRNTDENVEK